MLHAPNQYRVRRSPLASSNDYGNNGFFVLPNLTKNKKPALTVSCSDGAGWEHVDVSLDFRTPTWEEMCYVKNLFWDEEDEVVQFHPRKSEYIDIHPFCLHLWRPIGAVLPTPPAILVGVNL